MLNKSISEIVINPRKRYFDLNRPELDAEFNKLYQARLGEILREKFSNAAVTVESKENHYITFIKIYYGKGEKKRKINPTKYPNISDELDESMRNAKEYAALLMLTRLDKQKQNAV